MGASRQDECSVPVDCARLSGNTPIHRPERSPPRPRSLHLIRPPPTFHAAALNPSFRPKHAHGTYLTALMLAAKNSHDTDYRLGDWALIGQDIFEPGQLRENEWRMCERLGWRLTVHPMELVKTTWAIEMEYGEISEDVPSSEPITRTGSEVGLGGMFAGSVASSLSELSITSSRSLCSPWSGWGVDSPMHSSISTPHGANPICASSTPSPLILA
ncbi:hypothetical protein BN14_03596 [Rhizoctonia solani AG-1 IB]|uniref:Cyclin N-terminal domain-containing protein n=1 Tax=Thanatephorus cucumeris (strain AG1-IB / isolate 7/3/14) TaxID=1108050 RepID=M5BQS5_THACB|nr:hypothetical protein BN14_03596 [Rhizoctonia solani AG-1 IB]